MMMRVRRIGVVGVIALIAVAATALAASPPRPAIGLWTPSSPNQDAALATFTVASRGTQIKSLAFKVKSVNTNPGCPTGLVVVPGPLALRKFTFSGTRPFWAFGAVVDKHFTDAPVRATLRGKPYHGATLTVQFIATRIGGQEVEISGGTFSFTAKCQAALSEDKSAG